MAHKHPVYDTDKHFVIDPITKKISTECPKVCLPQHSHRSERFTFELPKEVEGHDMSLCNVVEIHFQNIEAVNKSNKNIGIYKVEDLQTDGDTVFGSWLIDGESTYYVGGLMFAIHFACVVDGKVEYNLPTLSYSAITIGETVWNSETIANEHPDIIAEFEARIQAVEQGGATPEQIESAVNKYLDENPVEVSGVVKTVNGNAPDENGNVEVEIPEGGTVTDEQIAAAVEDYLTEHPIDGNSNLLVVTFTEENGTLTPSHTYDQIKAWVNNGGHAVLTDGKVWYNLATLSGSLARFERVVIAATESYLLQYVITIMGTMDKLESHYNHIYVTAEVGQTIAVKSVDANGKPTEWEAVDMPTGGGGLDATIDGETLVFAESSTATIENETLIL